jgi:hypothetical protein
MKTEGDMESEIFEDKVIHSPTLMRRMHFQQNSPVTEIQ